MTTINYSMISNKFQPIINNVFKRAYCLSKETVTTQANLIWVRWQRSLCCSRRGTPAPLPPPPVRPSFAKGHNGHLGKWGNHTNPNLELNMGVQWRIRLIGRGKGEKWVHLLSQQDHFFPWCSKFGPKLKYMLMSVPGFHVFYCNPIVTQHSRTL